MLAMVPWAAAAENKEDYLSELQHRFLHVQQGWGQLGINTAAHARRQPGQPLTISGRQYANGLGHHAPGEIVVDLAGEYRELKALIGLQTLPAGAGSVVFKVLVDDQEKFDSGLVKQDSPPQEISVGVAGAQELRLVVTDGGDGINSDCANWVNARLVRAAGPVGVGAEQLLDIAPFAEMVTSDPARTDGARSTRVQEYREEDIYMETPVRPQADGSYAAGTQGGPACLGLKWMERRRLRQVGFEWAEGADRPPAKDVQVQCWHGESSWQGGWKPLGGQWHKDDDRWMMKIDWSSLPEARGGTRKVRFIFPADASIRRFIALSASPALEAELRIELERPLGEGPADVEIYNGEFLGTDNPRQLPWEQDKSQLVKVRYAKSRPWLTDRTVLRFRLPQAAFGVAVDDVMNSGCVYVRDFGLFVTRTDAGISLADYQRQIAGKQTILQQVRTMPDQTFAQATAAVHNAIQNQSPTMLSLACDNHKFIVHRDGHTQFSSDPPSDDKHMYDLQDTGGQINVKFGSGRSEKLTRGLDGEGWMPIVVTGVEEKGIAYRQRTFVAPTGKDGKIALGVIEYTAENMGPEPAAASVEVEIWANAPKDDIAEMASVPAGAIAFRRGRLIAAVRSAEAKPLQMELTSRGIRLAGTLPPRATSRMVVLIPTTILKPEQHADLPKAAELLRATKEHWEAQMAGAMQVELPDPLLSRLIKTSQVHCLIAARNEADGGRIAPWIASVSYGPLESESNSIIRGMDYFGHPDFCRKSLDFFIHRYSPEGFLTTGYTLMGTGWHLWMLGEHYALNRDTEWLQKAAPEVGRVCKWIVRQREKTMKARPDGSKPPEYGLMPPGIMADWNAFAYFFCLNGYYCAGLRSAAEALADVGVKDSAGWKDIARQFEEDILRAYSWTRARMPVYPLRNGTSVPGYPSQLHCPGPTGHFFPGEDGNRSWCYDVELGAHRLVPFGILGAASRETAWMMDHMEDVQFLSDGWFDYPAELSAKDPFNRGGFAKVQPYYCRNAEIYAMRDDVKPFVRTYFNTIPSLLNYENLSFMEHFAGVGAFNKTHETGYFLHQTRLMLVMERGDELWLAPLITNNWLKDGMTVAVTNAPTRFGLVSYRITSEVSDGAIEATIDPPQRSQPRRIVLRLRHPQAKPIREVKVNDGPHQDFDPAREIIRLSPGAGKITLRATY